MTSRKLSAFSLAAIFTVMCAETSCAVSGVAGEGYFGTDSTPPPL